MYYQGRKKKIIGISAFKRKLLNHRWSKQRVSIVISLYRIESRSGKHGGKLGRSVYKAFFCYKLDGTRR